MTDNVIHVDFRPKPKSADGYQPYAIDWDRFADARRVLLSDIFKPQRPADTEQE